MTQTKYKSTVHARKRLEERAGITFNESAIAFIKSAHKNGVGWESLPECDLKDYMFSKYLKKHKKIKLYKGFIYIFFKNSDRLITTYPLPEYYFEDYSVLKELGFAK